MQEGPIQEYMVNIIDTEEKVIVLPSVPIKKEIKSTINKIASGLIIYEIIMVVVTIIYMILRIIPTIISSSSAAESESKLSELTDQLDSTGGPYLIAVTAGVLFLTWYFRTISPTTASPTSNGKMKIKSFFMILCVFMSVQTIFSFVSYGMEAVFNQFGLSLMGEIESATARSKTITMFIYVSFLGPITEEIVFRGFILNGLKKYGKLYAIIISALVFGLFHGNLIQNIFAILVGLVLGYIAIEYSIYWSILFHIINNFIFAEVWSFATLNLSDLLQSVLNYTVYGLFFIGAVITILLKRKGMRNYLKTEKTEKHFYGYAFSSAWMIVYVILQLLLSIVGVEKI